MLLDSIPSFGMDGKPEVVTVQEFLRHHGSHFPKLTNEANKGIVQEAIESTYTMFAGVGTIWSNNDPEVWFTKTQLCYRLLIAWYICDLYPRFVSGVPTMGGIALKSKKIGDVNIQFSDEAVSNPNGNFRDQLGMLKSNPFGGKAYLMITTSIARNRVR